MNDVTRRGRQSNAEGQKTFTGGIWGHILSRGHHSPLSKLLPALRWEPILENNQPKSIDIFQLLNHEKAFASGRRSWLVRGGGGVGGRELIGSPVQKASSHAHPVNALRRRSSWLHQRPSTTAPPPAFAVLIAFGLAAFLAPPTSTGVHRAMDSDRVGH